MVSNYFGCHQLRELEHVKVRGRRRSGGDARRPAMDRSSSAAAGAGESMAQLGLEGRDLWV